MGQAPRPGQPLVTHLYTADPSAHVFEGRLYVYPSHDVEHGVPQNDAGDHFDMDDYHVLSMDDLESPVIDHGVALHIRDVPWAAKQLWAPDAAQRNGVVVGRIDARVPEREHFGGAGGELRAPERGELGGGRCGAVLPIQP